MELMIYILNIIITFIFLYFFLFIRKNIDLMVTAFLGYLIYFIPLYLPGTSSFENVYYVGWGILCTLLLATVFHDNLVKRFKVIKIVNKRDVDFTNIIVMICAILSLGSLGIQLINYGISDFFANKQDQLRDAKLHIIFSTSILLGLAFSYQMSYRKYLILFLILLGFIFISGDRTNIFIAFFTLLILSKKSFNFKQVINKKIVLSIIFLLFIGVFGKDVYGAVSTAYINDTSIFYAFRGRALESDGIYSSEPYHIATILNSIIEDDFRVDSTYLNDFLYHLLPNATQFTDTLHFFSNRLKSTYFSDWGDSSGVGATFWGEGLALFSILGLIFFYVIYAILLVVLNILYSKSSINFKPPIAIMGAYWATYIHRNSLFQMISHEKKVLYIFILIFVFSYFINNLLSRKGMN